RAGISSQPISISRGNVPAFRLRVSGFGPVVMVPGFEFGVAVVRSALPRRKRWWCPQSPISGFQFPISRCSCWLDLGEGRESVDIDLCYLAGYLSDPSD